MVFSGISSLAYAIAVPRQFACPVLDRFQLPAFECFENFVFVWIWISRRILHRTASSLCDWG
jgi:hypothetical protein